MQNEIIVDPEPRFPLSPYLYMQFMEPLGSTDSSVEAAWDHLHDCWRPDVIDITRQLAPTLIRWGGCFSSYYRWQEAVGPRSERVPMYNLLWGGMESNQVGTQEFVDFCRQVAADPLIAVNFEADGRQHWAHPDKGGPRLAGPAEAAAWVDYCNNPANALRRAHGHIEPYNVHLWQIGNETSYDVNGYVVDTAAQRTLAFAQAMRATDPSIELIGWGDGSPDGSRPPFARRMLEIAGGELNYLAFHHMYGIGQEDPEFDLRFFRRDPARTWAILMNAYKVPAAKMALMRQAVAGYHIPLAITESHFSLPGRNRNELLSTWAAGVAYARILNAQARNGDIIKIATCADFCGTRWMVNAIIIPAPAGRSRSFMMPVASVMSLYRQHQGHQATDIVSAPPALDVTASRTGQTIYLHVVNTERTRALPVQLIVHGSSASEVRIQQIAADPDLEIDQTMPDAFAASTSSLAQDGVWLCPAASVSVVELTIG